MWDLESLSRTELIQRYRELETLLEVVVTAVDNGEDTSKLFQLIDPKREHLASDSQPDASVARHSKKRKTSHVDDTANASSSSTAETVDVLDSKTAALQKPQSNPSSKSTSSAQKKTSPRKFDFSSHTRRPVALKIAYVGHDLYGYAMQPAPSNTNTISANTRSPSPTAAHAKVPGVHAPGQLATVESALFSALFTAKMIDESEDRRRWAYARCGRTDKGVSSFGQ
ncbi:tRNA pseudouridine synthase 3, partial [Gonapodya sp. JEL0774]